MKRRDFTMGAATAAAVTMAAGPAAALRVTRRDVPISVTAITVKETATSGFEIDLDKLPVKPIGTGTRNIRGAQPNVSVGVGVGGDRYESDVRTGIGLSFNLGGDRSGRDEALELDRILSGLTPIGKIGYSDDTLIHASVANAYRGIENALLLSDGESYEIGGLAGARSATYSNNLPRFGRLPVVGEAFRRTDTSQRRSEIVFILSPRLISLANR